MGTSLRVLTSSILPSFTKRARSVVRVWRNMKSRSGSWPRSKAWACVILCFCSGSMASFLICVKVGAMTKIVRKRAMPTSTWLGGALCVPMPWRMKPRTMMMRVKAVTQKSRAGMSVRPPTRSRSWTALVPSGPFIAAPSGP